MNLSKDPSDYALAGGSSGGIAAFTAAWNRPDALRRVLSFIGSYTSLRGGDIYPSFVRKTEPKPLRVFLQDDSNDLNIYAGSWYLGNQSLASALEFSDYKSKFVVGAEGHNGKHGGAILPGALRWLWQDYPNFFLSLRLSSSMPRSQASAAKELEKTAATHIKESEEPRPNLRPQSADSSMRTSIYFLVVLLSPCLLQRSAGLARGPD